MERFPQLDLDRPPPGIDDLDHDRRSFSLSEEWRNSPLPLDRRVTGEAQIDQDPHQHRQI
jgi:hypothetical protein